MSGLTLGFAVLTAAAVAALIWPVLWAPRLTRRASYDVAVYRDQLAEIGRDLERGLIRPAEARAARLEVERRLLRAAAPPTTREFVRGGGRATALATALLLPCLAGTLYWLLGSPLLPDQPILARQMPEGDAAPPPEVLAMVERLETRLKELPDDPEGWLMMARSRGVLDDIPGSLDAYRRAVALAPDDPRALAGLGEALVSASGNVVTPEARGLFERLAQQAPGEPRGAYYLGVAAAQAGDLHGAIERWRRLLADGPADAPWRQGVELAVREAAGELGLDPAAILADVPGKPAAPEPAGPAPSDGQVAMVRAMIGKLEERLADDRSDPEGWLRLGQARLLLGEREAAGAAFRTGLERHPDDPPLLKAYAATLVGPAWRDTGLPEITDAARELYAKALALRPDDLEAHWFLGIRALQDGHPADARSHWQRVLAGLAPEHPDFQVVKGQLDRLGS